MGARVFASIFEHRLLATSSSVAFFVLMAIFPALATIASLYGLFADPHAIPERRALLAGVVPTSIICSSRRSSISSKPASGPLGTAFGIAFLVSLWSANCGVSALFDALNGVHGFPEERSLKPWRTFFVGRSFYWS